MSETTLTGVVYKVGETQNVSDKFAKKELIIKTDGEYPQYIPIEFVNKGIDKIDSILAGQRVTVSYDLRGRLWTSPKGEEKCFSTINGWNIKVDNKQFDSKAPHTEQQFDAAYVSQNNDLPF